MKRDLDLVRELLEVFERELQGGVPIQQFTLEKDYDFRVVIGHLDLMIEHGLIRGECQPSCGDPSQTVLAIEAITWQGHDFLDAARNDTVWKAAKERLKKAGAWTFGLVLEVLKDEAKKRLGEFLP